jgi:hypothetical protein
MEQWTGLLMGIMTELWMAASNLSVHFRMSYLDGKLCKMERQ